MNNNTELYCFGIEEKTKELMGPSKGEASCRDLPCPPWLFICIIKILPCAE